MRPIQLLPIAVSLLLVSAASAANFTCSATASASCEGIASHVPINATTYSAIQSLFGVPTLRALLASNGLPPSTPGSRAAANGSTVRVPFPCACANGTGTSDRVPIYAVRAGDTLDAIATKAFGGLVTYKEIAAVNRIPDPDQIQIGQRVWIPLPCSCDPVAGEAVVHVAHVTAAGSSVAGIAAEYGTDEKTVMLLNGIADPKKLMAGQVLDVPLQACSSSSINKSSVDYGLLVPNGTYALTARDCIRCSCNSSKLDCQPTQGLSSSVCPAATCGSLSIGNTTTSGCDLKSCNYGGYTNSTFTIFAGITTESTCPSSGWSLMLGSKGGSWSELLIILHLALLCFYFLL